MKADWFLRSVGGLILLLVLALGGYYWGQHPSHPPKESFWVTTPAAHADPAGAVDDISTTRRNAIVKAARLVSPAVVTVNVIQTQVVRGYRPNSLFDWFFYDYAPFYAERQIPSLGSGFIINDQGYILTNDHVVENASKITISLPDGREFPAEVAGADAGFDLALVKIKDPPHDLPVAPLGDSDDLIIGEWAIAIGNPFGSLIEDPNPTVTVGVISAVKRMVKSSRNQKYQYRDLIQTDAAINPGNSGGPLVNANGQVIGINSFIFTESGGSVGMGFAIPINAAKRMVEEVIRYGKVRDIWVGLYVRAITPMLAQVFGLPPNMKGVLISTIERDGPADKAGLEVGDVIQSINNTTITSPQEAERQLVGLRVGDVVKFGIWREGRELQIQLVLEERK